MTPNQSGINSNFVHDISTIEKRSYCIHGHGVIVIPVLYHSSVDCIIPPKQLIFTLPLCVSSVFQSQSHKLDYNAISSPARPLRRYMVDYVNVLDGQWSDVMGSVIIA